MAAEVVDDRLDVPDRRVGGRHVEFAADLHGGPAGLKPPMAELERRIETATDALLREGAAQNEANFPTVGSRARGRKPAQA